LHAHPLQESAQRVVHHANPRVAQVARVVGGDAADIHLGCPVREVQRARLLGQRIVQLNHQVWLSLFASVAPIAATRSAQGCNRLFFKFSRAIHRRSGSGAVAKDSRSAKPATGSAAAATLTVYPSAWRNARTDSSRRRAAGSSPSQPVAPAWIATA